MKKIGSRHKKHESVKCQENVGGSVSGVCVGIGVHSSEACQTGDDGWDDELMVITTIH